MLLTSTMACARALEEFERQIARTPPVTTGFVEYRVSHQLKKPLRVSGTLEYRADGVLARNVDSPYREITEVQGDEVRITRADRPTRTLSLQRAPQLRVVLGSFRALLEGHLAPSDPETLAPKLEQDFEVALTEDAARWTITLKPRDERLGKHLARIDVYGAGDRPVCMEALEPDGDGALTLLSTAPATDGKPPTRAELEQTCRAGAANGAPAAQR